MRVDLLTHMMYYNNCKGDEQDMPTTARKIEKLVLKNGFHLTHQTGSHRHYTDGKGHYVIIPFHPGDMPIGTEKSILKQAGLK